MDSKSDLKKLNKKNMERFLQFPEDILLLDDEENPVVKRANMLSLGNRNDPETSNTVTQKVGSIIPAILKRAFPNLNYEAYKKMKKMVNILKETIPVCEECYLYHTRLNTTSGTISHSKLLQIVGESEFKGTGRLRPEMIRLRNDVSLDPFFGLFSIFKQFFRKK